MKLDRNTRMDLAASFDVTRSHLVHVRLDAEAATLMACDGHLAAIVPVTVEAGDVSGPLPDELFRETKGAISVACGDRGVTLTRPNAGEFPPLLKVMPTFKEGDPGTFTVCLDAKKLARVQRALGADNVTLTFEVAQPNAPLLVEDPTDSRKRGTLMPCRR